MQPVEHPVATNDSTILGIRGLLVHALSDEAKAFYEYHGFAASASRPMTLVMSLKG